MGCRPITSTRNFPSRPSIIGSAQFRSTNLECILTLIPLRQTKTTQTTLYLKWTYIPTQEAVYQLAPKIGGCLTERTAQIPGSLLTTLPTKPMEVDWLLIESCAYLSMKGMRVMLMVRFSPGPKRILQGGMLRSDSRVISPITTLLSSEMFWLITETVE
jgi:hypothetical protein